MRGRAAMPAGAPALVAYARSACLALVLIAAEVVVGCAAIEPPYPVRGAPPGNAEERRVAQAARRIVVGPPVDHAAWRALVAAAADEVAPLAASALAAPYADDRVAVLALAPASNSTRADDAADAARRRLRARYGAALARTVAEGEPNAADGAP